ncbi:MAG: hypothetical protein ACJ8F3_00185 [Xanthobacteraceae bacterium]
MNATVKRVRKRLERSGLRDRIVLGGLDVSLNVEKNAIAGWQWHLYLLVEGRRDEQFASAIREAFPPEPTALAPYDLAEAKDYIEAVTYACKALFQRRSGYDRQGKHRVQDQQLKGADVRELLPFLANHPAGARLILCGVRRSGHGLRFTHT